MKYPGEETGEARSDGVRPVNVRVVDLRSDTFTLPTREMYEALRRAPLGDDVHREDPTVQRLETLAAQRLGKEAGLLVSSGTQGNLVSVLAHCPRGSEIILGATSDLFNYEVSGLSALGGVMPRPVPDERGYPLVADVRAAIRVSDIHVAPTRLICLENTHQRAGGRAIPLPELAAIRALSVDACVPVHMDGARIFNAAVALGVEPIEIARHVDSVTFCLSKGLSCPIGSVVCGTAEFIQRARWIRKMLGGGMRQAGWIAAAGIVGLEQLVPRLADDHANARRLAHALARVPGLRVNPADVETNIVFVDVQDLGITADEFTAGIGTAGVRALPTGPWQLRMVAHRGVGPRDVDYAARVCARAAAGDLKGRTVPTASQAAKGSQVDGGPH